MTETSQTGEQIRVVVLTTRPLISEALGMALGSDAAIDVIGAHTNCDLAVNEIAEKQPDVAVVHTRSMAEYTALMLRLSSACQSTRLLALAPSIDHPTLSACSAAGAIGCVTEDDDTATVVDAIKRAHSGDVFLPSLDAPEDDDAERAGRSSEGRRPSGVPLGRRELEVLQLMAAGHSTELVAAELQITLNTVRTHMRNVMVKLQAHTKLEAVMIALRQGWLIVPYDC